MEIAGRSRGDRGQIAGDRGRSRGGACNRNHCRCESGPPSKACTPSVCARACNVGSSGMNAGSRVTAGRIAPHAPHGAPPVECFTDYLEQG